jgi:hypothetical protein
MTETGCHWRASCALNGCLGGRSDEPLCSRAWRLGWQRFIDAMQIAWKDPVHCEAVHLRWLATQALPIAGRTGARPGY